MEYFKLSNDLLMPKIIMGTNTFAKVNSEYQAPVTNDLTDYENAINNGYLMFDTAIKYRNEAPLGMAVKGSGIDRDKFFIVSKIPVDDEYIKTDELIRETIESSLKQLDLGYIELYLIHHQITDNDKMLQVWKILEEYYEKGLLKAIGVSNFTIEQIKYLKEHGRISPMVNQIKVNPSNWNEELIKDLLEHNVVPQAYSPLKGFNDDQVTLLNNIGSKYNKTWVQVITKYHINRGICVVSKSHNKERQAQNIDIFDFNLTKEDEFEISKMIREGSEKNDI